MICMQYNITYREKDNSWQYIISYKDTNGKWKQKSKQGFPKSRKGKLEAKEHAEKTVEDLKERILLDSNLSQENRDITFKQFLNMFLKHKSLYTQSGTITVYKKALRKFVALNDLEIRNITNLHIQSCIDEMLKYGLAANTILLYVTKLNTIFKAAQQQYKLISKSPVENLNLPEKQEVTKRALSKAELNDLLNKIKSQNIKFYMMSLIAATCGLRIGEIIGLTWNNIIDDKLHVTRQWKEIEPNKYNFGSLKTKNSERIVPIPPNVLSELSEYRKAFSVNYNGRIFPYVRTTNAAELLGCCYKKNEYNISVHELRHTYATMLIANGVDFKTAALLLGHDVEQTLKTYSHVTDDMLKNAQNIVNKIF